MKADTTGQPDERAGYRIREACHDQWETASMAEGRGFGEQDGQRRDEDDRKRIVTHDRSLDAESQNHDRNGNHPRVGGRANQDPGDGEADHGADDAMRLAVPHCPQIDPLNDGETTYWHSIGFFETKCLRRAQRQADKHADDQRIDHDDVQQITRRRRCGQRGVEPQDMDVVEESDDHCADGSQREYCGSAPKRDPVSARRNYLR